MSFDRSRLGIEEFRALRATVRERGTTRLLVTAITFVAWATLAIVVYAVSAVPLLAVVPLVVLAAGFEVVFAAHVGVERVGRYLQVHYEAPPGELPRWEQVVMKLGRQGLPSGGIDPLFSALFGIATFVNLAPIALVTYSAAPLLVGEISVELAFYAFLHALFIARILIARHFTRRQRARELELFQKDWTRPTDAPADRP
ncbi:MAG TPA: hypothetical protein VES67_10575 [Vicinamibacterales bacterium]|nr:hypothetical protein [Vicinamibacterales bacterium]